VFFDKTPRVARERHCRWKGGEGDGVKRCITKYQVTRTTLINLVIGDSISEHRLVFFDKSDSVAKREHGRWESCEGDSTEL